MAEYLLTEVNEKLEKARELCPNMSEDMYLLTDYLAKVTNNELYPDGIIILLVCAMDDLEKGRCGFGKQVEFPEKFHERKEYVKAQIRYFPQIIDAIADEEFAKEFRAVFKESFGSEPPRRHKTEFNDSKLGEYAKVAAQWWADQLAAPQVDNGDLTFAMFASLFGASVKEQDPAALEQFAVTLADAITQQVEYGCSHSCRLDVDYGPCQILYAAAQMAGLEVGPLGFPVKTHMTITRDEVRVACGYGGSYQTIWKADAAAQVATV